MSQPQARPDLTLVPRADDDDYRYDPPIWLGVMVMLILGALMSTIAYYVVQGVHTVYMAVRP